VQASSPAEALSAGRPPSEQAALPLVLIRSARSRQLLVWSLRLLALVLLFGSWELSARVGWVKPLFTSQPSAIFPALWTSLRGNLVLVDLPVSLYEMLAGFLIGSALGIGVGLVLHEFPLANEVLQPFLTAFNSMPRIALAPLFVLWFGLGPASKIVLVVSLVFFIVLVNTTAGLKASDRDYLLLARTLGAGRWTTFRKFVFPAATPTIFAGLQLGLVYSLLGTIAGEMLGGTGGVGARMAVAVNTFHTDEFFAALLFLVILSTALGTLVRRLELWLLHWRFVEMRGLENR
jgi:NitT/TauT family transport system permease protein